MTTMDDVIASRMRVIGNDLLDLTNIAGLLLYRAPNRYRKLMRDPLRPPEARDPWGCDVNLEKIKPQVIEMQNIEFGIDPEWCSAGITATMDNDWALLWLRRQSESGAIR